MINFFNININEFVAHLLPVNLRKTRLVHWLLCLSFPFKNIYTLFTGFRNTTNYKLDHTMQVYSMVNVFNDKFDQSLRRIRIVDGIYKSPVYFFEPEENAPVHFYEATPAVIFYEPEELALLDVDFVILLPFGFVLSAAEEIRMRAECDYYRSPDKTYEIRIDNE